MAEHDLNMTRHENISILQEDFRTAMIQVVTEAGEDPENPKVRQAIELAERKYAVFLEKTRICMSGKNSVPGFREVMILSPELFCYTNANWPGIIAVTSEGRLVTGTIRHGNPDNKNPIVPIQVIDSLQTGQSGPEFPDGDYSLVFDNSGSTSMSEIDICIIGCKNIHETIDIYSFDSIGNRLQSKFYDFLEVQMEKRIDKIRHLLFTALDNDVLQDMQESVPIKIEYGYWLTGGDGASENVVIARRQAIRAYPALAEQLYYQFHNTIDASEPLSPVIAKHYNTSERKLKRLRGLTREYIDIDLENHYQRIIDIFDLSDGTVPKNQKQFLQLNIIKEFGRRIWDLNLPGTMNRLSEGGNLWQLVDRIEQTSADNVLDSVRFLVRKLLVPFEINKIQSDQYSEGCYKMINATVFNSMILKAKKQVLTCFSARELLDLDQRYHRNITRYEDRLDIITVNRDWPGMLGTIDLGNGCIARELTSSRALKTQGRVENHCVGGYVSRILNSHDHSRGQAIMIFSIEQDNQILSTAEINCFREFPESDNSGQLRTEVYQNKAHNNTIPSRMSESLAKQVAARVQQAGPKAFQTYLDGLHEVRVQHDRVSGLEYHIVECGLDPCNRVHLEAAWEELGRILPKRFRRNGPGDLVEYGLAGKAPEERSRKNRPDNSRWDNSQSDKTDFSETGFSETEQEGILEYDEP